MYMYIYIYIYIHYLVCRPLACREHNPTSKDDLDKVRMERNLLKGRNRQAAG